MMPNKPPETVSKPAPDTDRYMQGDPIPVPEATEANSASAWALFSDTLPPQDTDFLDTVAAPHTDEPPVAPLPDKAA